MRVLFAILMIALCATPAFADSYGEKLSDAEVIEISTLMETPEDYVGKTVKVEGRITGVCAHRGCWIEIAGDEDYQSLRFKVDDGVMVFPAEAMGHVATAEGVFTKIELTPEQAHAVHKAGCDKNKKEGEAGCSHGVPEDGGVIYQLAGLGAVVE
jgi:hypothetical protein